MAVITIIAENVTAGAKAPAPREGRHAPLETDATGAQVWLDAFAALPSHDAEEADARLHLSTPSCQLRIRHAGGRMIMEEGNAFTNATVAEVLARLQETAGAGTAPEAEAEDLLLPPGVLRRGPPMKIWLLGALALACVLLFWWRGRAPTIDGVVWVKSSEAHKMLADAAGHYRGANEELTLAADGHLRIQSMASSAPQDLPVRAGRRTGVPVFLAANGVLIEVVGHDKLVANGANYQRVP